MVCYMFIYLQNCLNTSDVKFVPASEINFLGSPNSANTILAASTRSSATCQFYFTIGNMECFISNKKYISANDISRFAWYFKWDCLLM